MSLDDRLDLYEVKAQFERFTEWLDLGAIVADLGFLRRARRTLLPLPLIDQPEPVDVLDRGHWPRLIRQGHEAATAALDRFR